MSLTNANDIKRRWRWLRAGNGREPHHFGSLKAYARAEARHAQYSNWGLQCWEWLRAKGCKV